MSNKRQYNSSLRAKRAAETRDRIQRATRKLIGRNGFAETTVGQIADEAGVAAQTVYATFGSKAGIVGSLLAHLEEEARLPEMIASLEAEQNPHAQLRIFTAWIRRLYGMSIDIFSAVIQSQSQPEMSAIRQNGDANRLRGCRLLAGTWAEAGVLPENTDPESVASHIWLTTSLEAYIACTETLGWNPDQYEDWLNTSLEKQVFG